MPFSDMKLKLAPYFADELIADVEASMPQGASYRVWGWDVGDFTGDGYNDLALSIHILGTRKRECNVYLIADIDGFMMNVGEYRIKYVELPLEVGVVIKENTCYVVQKEKADHWVMRGYRYVSGSIVKVDEFISNKIERFAHEGYRNYQTLETRDKYVFPNKRTAFETRYLTIPCYQRGRQVYAGIVPDVQVDKIRNVVDGAYWWKGSEDASFSARIVYDQSFLYLRVKVKDSTVVTGWCDTCPADRLEIWFDVTPPDELGGSRYITTLNKSSIEIRTETDSGLYAFAVKIGDFQEVHPSIKVRTTDELSVEQEDALAAVRVVTAQRADGYIVKMRIPFVLLEYDQAPLLENELIELGCTVALYDVDNEFRESETTTLATSAIQPLDPSTYGVISFIPDGLWYGETANIYADAILGALRELGF